ncbi:MAG: hypothetical protein WC284_12205 [Candidimonas sp.]
MKEDRVITSLNDKWVLMADDIQWMIARRTKIAFQPVSFCHTKSTLLRLLREQNPREFGPIDDEAMTLIHTLPEEFKDWIATNTMTTTGGRGRSTTMGDIADDVDVIVGVAKRTEDSMVLIPTMVRTESGFERKDITVPVPMKMLQTPVKTANAEIRRTYMGQLEADGKVVRGVKSIEAITASQGAA